MKTLVLSFILTFTYLSNFAQTSTDSIFFLDSKYKKATEQDYVYKKIVRNYYEDRAAHAVEYFYKSGQLKETGISSNRDFIDYQGLVTSYHENGNLYKKIIYKDNSPISVYKSWHENGKKRDEGLYIPNPNNNKELILRINQYWDENETQKVINGEGIYIEEVEKLTIQGTLKNGLKNGVWHGTDTNLKITFSENYEYGNFISGISTDKDSIKHNYSEILQKPSPKKGIKHFYEYVAKRFNIRGNYKGKAKIFLQFIVDKDGEIDEVEVIKGVNPTLDKEAIRVLKTYEKWLPGKQRGVNVNFLYSLPLSFDLE